MNELIKERIIIKITISGYFVSIVCNAVEFPAAKKNFKGYANKKVDINNIKLDVVH